TPLYIVLDGELDIKKGGEVTSTISAGAIVGEKLILESDLFDFSCVSKNTCKLLVLRKEELMDLMSLHLEIVEAILGILKEGAESIEEESTMELFV
ncbi:MAG: cyclic nucleotide-binding domain-containing protein, partial [Cyclobacteriaceae bacterium]